jgi:hypothetical protein
MDFRKVIAMLLIVFAIVVAYANSFSGVFVYDDYVWIVENIKIRNLLSSVTGSSRPLVGLSLYLNYAAGGKLADFHAVNMTIHIISSLLLMGAVLQTLELPSLAQRYKDRSLFLAFVVTIVWAVHPLNTESVTYVIQRSESLMGLFFLLVLYCFARGAVDERRRIGWHSVAVLSCILGMGCKPVMAVASAVVLLYDRTFVAGTVGHAFRQHKLMYAGFAVALVLLGILLLFPNESTSSAGFGAVTLSPAGYLLTQSGVILHYLKLAFWPTGLCLDYDWLPSVGSRSVLETACISLLVLVSIVLAIRRHPAGFVGLAFFLTLMPTSSVVPLSDCAAEHRMYLPLICVVILVVFMVNMVVERWDRLGNILSRRLATNGVVILIAVAVVLLAISTIKRNKLYHSEEAIWRDVVTKCPWNPRGYLGVGAALLKQNNLDMARNVYIEALRSQREEDLLREGHATELAMIYNNMGSICYAKGKHREAETYFKKAARLCWSEQIRDNLRMVSKKIRSSP